MHRLFNSFRRDQEGAIAIIFAVCITVILGFTGLMVDGARAYNAANQASSALDASALAAAKAYRERSARGDELLAVAHEFFEANIERGGGKKADFKNLKVFIDPETEAITVAVDTDVETYFGGLFNMDRFEFTKSSTALYNITDLELAMMLDMTGSMRGAKIDALRAAATDIVDILIDEQSPARRVRIGFAPYSSAVNAGRFAKVATNNRSQACVAERGGNAAFGQAAPNSPATFLNPDLIHEGCPAAEIVPLSNNKRALKDGIRRFAASGDTAGHLGVAWSWYILSPRWKDIWPSDSEPRPYGDKKTIKAALLMTDGVFNVEHVPGNGNSKNQARRLCRNMKRQGIVVFTIAFDADGTAEDLLQECASSPSEKFVKTYFDANNESQLRLAFREIASQLNTLRLTE